MDYIQICYKIFETQLPPDPLSVCPVLLTYNRKMTFRTKELKEHLNSSFSFTSQTLANIFSRELSFSLISSQPYLTLSRIHIGKVVPHLQNSGPSCTICMHPDWYNHIPRYVSVFYFLYKYPNSVKSGKTLREVRPYQRRSL